MDLIDKIFGYQDGDDWVKMPSHEFTSGIFMWARGFWTRAELVSRLAVFGLNEAEDGTDLDWLAARYTALTGDAKLHFFMRLETCCLLAETGIITKAEFQSYMNS